MHKIPFLRCRHNDKERWTDGAREITSKTLYVGGIADVIHKTQIYELFTAEQPEHVDIPTKGGDNCGYAFVHFDNEQVVSDLVKKKVMFGNKPLTLHYAKDPPSKAPGKPENLHLFWLDTAAAHEHRKPSLAPLQTHYHIHPHTDTVTTLASITEHIGEGKEMYVVTSCSVEGVVNFVKRLREMQIVCNVFVCDEKNLQQAKTFGRLHCSVVSTEKDMITQLRQLANILPAPVTPNQHTTTPTNALAPTPTTSVAKPEEFRAQLELFIEGSTTHSVNLQEAATQFGVSTTDITHVLNSDDRDLPYRTLQLVNNTISIKPVKRHITEHMDAMFHNTKYHNDLKLQLLEDEEGWITLEQLLGLSRMRPTLELARTRNDNIMDIANKVAKHHPFVHYSSKHRVPVVKKKSLKEVLVGTIEYYFSSHNLQYDVYLNQLLATETDEENFLPVYHLMGFPRISSLLPNESDDEDVFMHLLRDPRCPLTNIVVHKHKPALRLKNQPKAVTGGVGKVGVEGHGVEGHGAEGDKAGGGGAKATLVRMIGTTEESRVKDPFVVMQYNMLAQCYCNDTYMPYIKGEHQPWDLRWLMILQQIDHLQPTVLALQELQATLDVTAKQHYVNVIVDSLGRRGYEHEHVIRDVPDTWPKHKPILGVALFWKKDSFVKRKVHKHRFNRMLEGQCRLSNRPGKAYTQYASGTQVGLTVVLEQRTTSQIVVVSTVHVSAKHTCKDIQLAQVHALLQAVSVEYPADPHLLLGDFNCQPHDGAIQYITQGSLPANHPHLKPSIPKLSPIFPLNEYIHGLRMQSAIGTLFGAEPAATNKQGPPSNFEGTLDYVFYTPHLLTAVAGSEVPDLAKVAPAGIPNGNFPSDHVPLAVKFSFGCAMALD